MRAWMRPTPLNCQPPMMPLRIGFMFAAEPLPAADRHRPVPLRLDRVTDVAAVGLHHAAVVEAGNAEPPSMRVLIADVDRQPFRQPPPQLDLQRVVVAERAAVGHVDRRRRPD